MLVFCEQLKMHGCRVMKDGGMAYKVLKSSHMKTVLLYGFKSSARLVCLGVFKFQLVHLNKWSYCSKPKCLRM